VVPAAPPTAEELLASVAASREQGYGVARGETIEGVNTVAAPVRGADGRTVATVSVTGPASRMDDDRIARLVPDLLRCVEAVSTALGYER
jgi:DNA-binding IclR family transcriptional regulator